MMKGGLIEIQQPQAVVEENMSNLTSATSNEASVSSVNRNDSGGGIYPQQYFVPSNPPQVSQQTQQQAKKKRNLPGNPDPEAEVIALSPKALLATNRFVCEICNKGFQRDQNLQLHRRGHNLPWKLKQRTNKEVRKKVYVCPEPSCVHHDPSRALGDLTGIKKHFCRKHGEKKWKCDKCSKRYAVQSDWKAHSKTCGTREYRCDCGTLFSRRDSFITHRAFCDALAEESARAIPGNPPLLSSEAAAGGSSSTSHHMNSNVNPLQPQFSSSHDNINPHLFSLKKEHHSFSTPLRPEIPPWLACPPAPPHIDLTSPSSIFPPDNHQDLSPHENPNLPPFHPTSPHISATALLQKAAQMGATMSSKSGSIAGPAMLSRPHQAHHVSAVDSGTIGHGGHLHPPPPSLLQDMMIRSLSPSSAITTTTAGFEGSSAFEDAFGGIFNPRKNDHNFHQTLSKVASNDQGGNDGMTRDFLGLKPLSHSDIFNIAGLGNCMNSASSTEHHHQNTSQKSWQG